MTNVSAIRATVRVGNTYVEPTSLRLTLDQEQAPYAKVSLEVPYDEETWTAGNAWALSDPREAPRLTVHLSHYTVGWTATLDQLARSFAPSVTLDNMGWTGTLTDVSHLYALGWGDGLDALPTHMDLDLCIGLRRRDHATGLVTFEAQSDEVILMDGALVDTIALIPQSRTVLGAVVTVFSKLSRVLDRPTIEEPTGANQVENEAAVWDPGESGWSYLSPLVASAGLRLWCDEQRNWHLVEASDDDLRTVVSTLTAYGSLKALSEESSRDTWADAVVIRYRWEDPDGTTHTTYEAAGDIHGNRCVLIERERPWPGGGEAAARLAKWQRQGRTVTFDAVADLTLRPYTGAEVTDLDGNGMSGTVTGVTWSLPADTMTVTMRSVIDS